MLKDNILLTAHANVQLIQAEILKEMEKKIDKYDEICFETDLLEVMVSHPQQIMILDYYLAFLALKKNKKISYFSTLEEETKQLIKCTQAIEKLKLSVNELMRIEEIAQKKYMEMLKEIYIDKKSDMTQFNKEYNAITSPKHTAILKEAYSRDSKWDLSDNKKLYVFGFMHNENINCFEGDENETV